MIRSGAWHAIATKTETSFFLGVRYRKAPWNFCGTHLGSVRPTEQAQGISDGRGFFHQSLHDGTTCDAWDDVHGVCARHNTGITTGTSAFIHPSCVGEK